MAQRVTVVGSGVVGLTSAMELLDAGFDVRIVARDALLDTVSAVAAAVWSPFHVAPNARTDVWDHVGLRKFNALAADTPEAGIRIRHCTMKVHQSVVNPWWLALPSAREITPVDADYRLWEFDRVVMDMSVYLPWLEQQALASGATIERRTLNSLDDVSDADVIVNCTGLGARELVGDKELRPLRGQLVEVTCPDIDRCTVYGDGPGGLAHIFPLLNSVILGGTEDESEDMRVNKATTQAILERCTAIEPRLAGANVVRVKVGLRPARSEVRVELDQTAAPVPVIHNYGHGGGGVTLSWGCAQEVRELCIGTMNSNV